MTPTACLNPCPTATPSTDTASRRSRILVAEDNPINQEVIIEQLALLGLDADRSDDGLQAFDRWRQDRHGLLITDLQMPRLDGYQLTQAIRAYEAAHGLPRTCIVALSASAEPAEHDRCLQAGMDGHLPKPLELDVLKARLGDWLDNGPDEGTHDAGTPTPGRADADGSQPLPLLDADVLCQFVGDDPATLAHFREDFRARLAPMHQAMADAAARDDLVELGSLAHQLKSTSRTLGALLLGQRCESLERSARAGLRDHARHEWPPVAAALFDTRAALVRLVQPGGG